MSKAENLKTKAWALRESARLETEWPKGSPMETRVLGQWKHQRPEMVAELGAAGAAALAHVLVDRTIKAEQRYLQAGMAPTDAREQAEQECLLLEPEDESESPVLDGLITSSPIQTD